MSRQNNGILWKYYVKNPDNKTAMCQICEKWLSYKTTITNLKQHLRLRHIESYDEMNNSMVAYYKSVRGSEEGEESDNSSKQDDLNSYFELQTGGRVRCVLCHSSVPQREEAQRAHMQEKHQKLVRDQDQEQEEDRMPFHSDDENEQDIFSNVIYVDEQRQAEKSPPKKNSSKPLKKFTSQKRRERDSTSSEEVVIRKKKLKIDNDDELEGFLRYIGCLLKKLPNEKFMQLQMEIVNLIMKTSMLNQNDTSVTVPVPSTSYYVTMPDKVLQSDTSLGTVTQANISTDLCGNPSTIIINSVKESDGNEKQL